MGFPSLWRLGLQLRSLSGFALYLDAQLVTRYASCISSRRDGSCWRARGKWQIMLLSHKEILLRRWITFTYLCITFLSHLSSAQSQGPRLIPQLNFSPTYNLWGWLLQGNSVISVAANTVEVASEIYGYECLYKQAMQELQLFNWQGQFGRPKILHTWEFIYPKTCLS